jgi:nascent polypeptide-associated complex subunit alpha
MNPRQIKKMMRQMGMEMEEINAEEVIIKLQDSEIVIQNPSINVITAKNQKTYQIMGEEKVIQKIPSEDIKLVAMQAGVSEEEARKALEKTGGDLAEAITILSK